MCHGCAGRFLGRFPTKSWKLSGSFPEAKPSQRAPGPRSALALVIQQVLTRLNQALLARAVEPRIVRGANLVRFHAHLTTPLANIETNTMVFGSARMEMTVFGVIVFQFPDWQNTSLHFPICQVAFFWLPLNFFCFF